jgi:hypothetical protein
LPSIGKQITCGDIVIGLEEVVDVRPQLARRFGTASAGLNLFHEVWEHEEHVFAAEGTKDSRSKAIQLGHPGRISSEVLNRHPVEVLAIDEGEAIGQPGERYWTRWMDRCRKENLPAHLLIAGSTKELVDENGLQSKAWRRRFQGWGYEVHYWFLRGHEHGGVVRQDRCMVVLRRKDANVLEFLAPHAIVTEGDPRSARNMLRACGVPRKSWMMEAWTPKSEYPQWITEATAPCVLAGETAKNGLPIFSPDACLPDKVGAFIRVDKGVRRVLIDELAKAKGVPASRIAQDDLTTRTINGVTDLHIWAAAASSLVRRENATDANQSTPRSEEDLDQRFIMTEEHQAELEEWEWEPPDLSVGGAWHTARVKSLETAIVGMTNIDELRIAGHAALTRHRANYGKDGTIQQLQILWWEFPPEHWEELRCGCPMNFLTEPWKGTTPNAQMTEEQADIAAEFIDELWSIGVFELIPEGREMKGNAPLFTVAKAGQPGQWRVIADMKNGGQNDHIGKDPVHLPRAGNILERLYTGGWSAIADASKFFHNFPTHPKDRPYLGCIHPKTGQRLWYLGLPMGSSQSPSLACRYGLSMLRKLAEEEPVFQGKIQENGWRRRLDDGEHQPELGTGLIRIGEDGLPTALIWAFVDDFQIHAPTREKLVAALTAFMDLALRLGLICQKVKTKPPAQVQKYCGFIYDTTGVPTLRIPEDKRGRALAMIEYLRAGSEERELSRLTLAVVTGLLQSMVDATPQRIGQTFLRRLYDRLHALEESPETRPLGKQLYYTRVRLTEEEWLDLAWWEAALRLDISVKAYSTAQGVLGVSYGDGSGSGTGGTVQILGRDGDCPTMEAWMGTWRGHVHIFSSNWRELRTLVHTLERELEQGHDRLRNATLFYFTDNLVTYYIVSGGSSSSPELQKLIRRLKYLELALGVRLEVVHIPGKHMIDQRTDGLSRGLRLTGGGFKRTPREETQRIFEGLPATSNTIAWARRAIAPFLQHRMCSYMDGSQAWTFHQIVGRATLWLPSPEWAHQLIDAVVNAWTEQPWITEAFFIIPRVFQRDWGRVSKHIQELGQHASLTIPDYGDHTDIPCIMLHLPCYVRTLPQPRWMDGPARPQGAEWHQEQAEYVRGLS